MPSADGPPVQARNRLCGAETVVPVPVSVKLKEAATEPRGNERLRTEGKAAA